MAMLLVIIGIIGFAVSLGFLSAVEYKIAGILFFISVMCFVVLTIKNDEPTKIEHINLLQNTWDDITFDGIKEINYDEYYYPWWTYRGMSNPTQKNLIISDMKEE